MPATLENPYAREAGQSYRWLKGNLHSHSNRSDGTRPPQEVIDSYAKLGYDFMALTDHDIFSDYTKIDPKGLILLRGNEVSNCGPHMLQIGGTHRIDPLEDRQKVIDQVNADGGIVVINHPNWEADWDHHPFESMQKLTGYVGMEVFNGVCIDLEGSALAWDKWDRLLSTGRIVWAFANDDSHRPPHDGRGWNVVMVRQDQATPAGILAALRDGHFYASSGVQLDTIETRGTELHLAAANAQEIEIYGERGVRVARAVGSEIHFDAAEANALFIRAQLYGSGSAMAWTQPFILRGGTAENRRALEEKFGGLDSVRPTLGTLRVETIPPLGSAQADDLWRRAAASDLFYDNKTASTPPVRTAISALVSGQQLAIKIDCQEPEMDKVRTTITTDGNGSIWTEESVEIYLDVDAERKRYYQIMINPLGALYAGHPLGWAKALKYQTRPQRSAQGWSVELLLDLATLAPGLSVAPGTRFGFHVCRNRLTVGKNFYMWSWVGSSNHTPSRFGWLQL